MDEGKPLFGGSAHPLAHPGSGLDLAPGYDQGLQALGWITSLRAFRFYPSRLSALRGFG